MDTTKLSDSKSDTYLFLTSTLFYLIGVVSTVFAILHMTSPLIPFIAFPIAIILHIINIKLHPVVIARKKNN